MSERNSPPRYPFALYNRDGKPVPIATTPPGHVAGFRTRAEAEAAREEHYPSATIARAELAAHPFHIHEGDG